MWTLSEGCRALRATNHGSRSKTRESPESDSPCQRDLTNTAEGAQKGSQRRERGSWETPAARQRACGRPRTRYRTLTVSWNAIIRARRGAVAEDLGMVRRWGLGARPQDAPPDPRVVIPCRIVARLLTLNAYEYASTEGRDLLVPHGPHPNSRDLNDRRFGDGAGMRWLRRVFGQAHAQRQCPVNITWH